MSDALGAPVTTGIRHSYTLVYLRFVALLLLAAGLARAGMVLGIAPGEWSFGNLEPAWRAGAVTLIFVDLFAAIGLWIGATWGPVMWAVALVVEVSMYTIFAHLFGVHMVRILIHAILFGVFLFLSVRDWRRVS